MAELWEAPDDIRRQVRSIKDEHHAHLAQASIWVLCSDGKGVRDNRIVATQTKKCTKTEKLSTGCDFKIIVLAETWSKLTDAQRRIALDEALCRCGVHRVPQTMEVNGKKEPVTDDWGRTVYTDEIAYDKLGNPRWKLNQPDADLFFALLVRHGQYNEAAENVARALNDQPLKQPIAAERADQFDQQLERTDQQPPADMEEAEIPV